MQRNRRYGWMSDTNTFVGDAQYVYSENIEVRKNPEYLRLSNKSKNRITTDYNVVNMLTFTDRRGIFLFWEWWQVSDLWVPLYTLSWWEEILDAIAFNDYYLLFYVRSNRIRMASIDIGSANAWNWTGNVTEDIQDWTGTVIEYDIWYNSSNQRKIWLQNRANQILYIASWKSTHRLFVSSGWDRVSEALIENIDNDFVWITQHGNYFHLYLNNWRKYLWDWQWWETKQLALLNTELNITNVIETPTVDYIVWDNASQDTTLYYSAWLDMFKKVKKTIKIAEPEEKYKFLIESWSISNHFAKYYDDITYFTGKCWDDADTWALISIWQEYDWFQTSVVNSITGCDWWNGTISAINCITTFGSWFLYYAWEWDLWWESYWVDYIYLWEWKQSSQEYQKQWELWSKRENYWNNALTKKIINSYIRADVDTSNYINVYYSIDWGSRTLWKRLDDSTKKRHKLLDLNKKFYEIQIKLEFVGTWTSTPKLYQFNLLPQVINEP